MKKLILLSFSLVVGMSLLAQDCTDLFISEYVEGTGNNKALELYNPTNDAIDLSDYKLVRYSNGGTTPYSVNLAGSIAPKSTFVAVLDKRDPNGTGFEQPVDSALMLKADTFLCPVYEVNRMMYFNGNDAVSLEKISSGAVVDLFGFVGPPMTSDDNGWGDLNDTTITYNNGGVPTQYTIQNYIVGPLFWLSWTENNTLIRKPDVGEGVKANPPEYFQVFVEWDSIPENTFDSLGFHNCDCSTFSIDENYVQSVINIYPNPVTDGKITIEAEETIAEISIFDVSGKLIEYTQLQDRNKSYSTSIENEYTGYVFVRVGLSNGQQLTKKILLM